MPGPISRLLAEDHARLDALLTRATARPGEIDAVAYAAFRAGLLKHIGMEEKILLPAAQRACGGEPLSRRRKTTALRTAPDVPVHVHVDGPRIMEATRRALARAGYSLDDSK